MTEVHIIADSGNWSQVTNEVKMIHSKSHLNIKHHTVHLKYIYNLNCKIIPQ